MKKHSFLLLLIILYLFNLINPMVAQELDETANSLPAENNSLNNLPSASVEDTTAPQLSDEEQDQFTDNNPTNEMETENQSSLNNTQEIEENQPLEQAEEDTRRTGGVIVVGTVIDSESTDPIEGATVYFEGLGEYHYTDSDGNFFVSNVPTGIIKITVIYPGFYRWQALTNIYEDMPNNITIRLIPNEEFEPLSIPVEAEYIKTEVSRQNIRAPEIQNMAGTQGDIIKAVVTSMPGIALASSLAAAGFTVRGGNPDENFFYFDNMRLIFPFHFGGFVSVIHPEMVESIDFYAGGFPAGFGNKMGSVFDIHSKNMAESSISGKVNINILTADFFLEGPIGDDWYFMIAGRRSYFDLVLMIMEEFDVGLDVKPYFWDYQAKITYHPHNDHYIDLLAIGAFDQISMEVSKEETSDDVFQGDAGYKMQFFSQGFNYKWIATSHLLSLLSINWTLQNIKVKLGTDPDTGLPYNFDMDNHNVALRWNFQWKISESHELHIGPYITLIYVPYTFYTPRIPAPGEIIYSFEDLLPAISGESIYWALNNIIYIRDVMDFDVVKIDVGVELTYFTAPDNKQVGTGEHTEEWYASPRANIMWKVLEEFRIIAAFGLYFQNPSTINTIKEFGTPSLSAPFCFHYITGIKWDITDTTSVSVEGYFKDYYNMIVFNQEMADNLEGVESAYHSNEGRKYSYGVEVFFKQELIYDFYGWVAYTFSMTRTNDGYGGGYYPDQYDQNHIVTLILSYQPLDWLRFGLKWRLNTGTPYTPIEGREHVLPQDKPEPQYIPVLAEDLNSARMPLKHQLDFRVDFIFDVGSWGVISFYIDAMNLYYQENVMFYAYESDYSNFDHPDEVYDLPIIPSLGFEWKF